MGLPIGKLVIATNVNDILARTLATGRYEVGRVQPTLSPSMDIQISSNFERLLFEAVERNPDQVRAAMQSQLQSGAFNLSKPAHAYMLKYFTAFRCDEDETLQEISRTFVETGLLIDPHTAVGRAAARKQNRNPQVPMVTLATAHPAKFPDPVTKATGKRPTLPPRYDDLARLPERCTTLPNDLQAVENFIKANVT